MCSVFSADILWRFSPLIALLLGWLLDLCFGDPARLPHPIVWFGKWIGYWEHRLNHGRHRKLKGGILAVGSIALVFILALIINFSFFIFHSSIIILQFSLFLAWNTLVVFFCLAGTTLIREVRAVFLALDRSLDDGRRQVARIVGRETGELTAQEVRAAALETLAENLSDGVVAPLFWFALLGAPGMLAYKMVNTLDSMIGYRTERYRDFGCWAAHIDDVANYIPARLTALLMIILAPSRPPRGGAYISSGVGSSPSGGFRGDSAETLAPPSGGREGASSGGREETLFSFVRKYGRCHASPNSGYPEAALAGILDCRFGGPHYYFGELFDKPFIGETDRQLSTADMRTAVRVNRFVEVAMVAFTAVVIYFSPF